MTRKPLLVGALVLVVATVTDVAPPIRLAPALRLKVSVDGACPGVEGVGVGSATSVTYCYTVTNTGSAPARDIVITDARGTVRVGTLRGGQSRTIARTLAVTPDAGWLGAEPGVATTMDEAVAGTAEAASMDGVTPELSVTATAQDDPSFGESQPGLVFRGAAPAPATNLQSP